MPTLTIDGRTLRYHDVGTGPHAWLLFHGFPFSSESFAPQLEQPPAGYRLIVPDLRGFGESALDGRSARTSRPSLDDYAHDGLQLLSVLGLSTALIGGVSMGGYVSLALTRLRPDVVGGLVLIDTQASADDEAGRQRREATALALEKDGMGALVEAMLPKLLTADAPERLREELRALMACQNPLAAAFASRAMAGRSDSRDVLSRFAGPCLVVVGEHDVITPIDRARAMADLVQGASLKIIPNAGHLPNLEQPQAFGAALEAFAEGLGATR
jgi:pimeloyl-ACP methyl ester carboxylesterase